MKKIFIDMDGILNDFNSFFIKYHNLKFNTNFEVCTENMQDYDIVKALNIPQENFDEILLLDEFWENLPVKEYAQESVEKLYSYFDIYILTAPYIQNINNFTIKINWIKKYFSFIDLNKVIFCYYKYLIDGQDSYLIDDNPTHLQKWKGTPTTLEYPFNENVKSIRFKDWKEIVEHLCWYNEV